MRLCVIFCFKQKTAYEMRISDWSSDGCSSDLFRTFGSREIPELRDNGIRAVAVGGNGDLLVATSRGGVSVRRRGVWTSYTKADGLAQNESMAIAEDRAGNIWVAHESEGVSRIGADGSIRVIDVLPGEDSGLTYAVFVDHTDVVWVGSGEGLVRIEGKRSEEHTSELQSLMRISYAVFCLKKKTREKTKEHYNRKPSTQLTERLIYTHDTQTTQ